MGDYIITVVIKKELKQTNLTKHFNKKVEKTFSIPLQSERLRTFSRKAKRDRVPVTRGKQGQARNLHM